MYKHFIKRLIDLCISLLVLIIVSPILFIVAILLAFFNKGAGVFFCQERPGWNNKIFKVIKFKTMTDERDAYGNLLPNKDRITPFGKFVRAASLDELPQLINVVRGDMSLIGPRPLLTWFLPLYDETQIRRHEVRPGITGWAQVNGRNLCKYSQKFEYDVWYVDHLSFGLDIKILWMTFVNVIRRKDIGNGLQNEVDDLGWGERKKEAEELFENSFRNKR